MTISDDDVFVAPDSDLSDEDRKASGPIKPRTNATASVIKSILLEDGPDVNMESPLAYKKTIAYVEQHYFPYVLV